MRRLFGSRAGLWIDWCLISVCVTYCLYLALTHLGPHSDAVALFNSDAAIPVLMSNDTHFDAFRLYFYAQDRFGALPFLLAGMVRGLSGLTWTPELLAAYRTVWLFSSIVFLLLLARPFGGLAVAAFCATIFVAPMARFGLFGLEQVYPWSLPLLLAAWWQLRRHCEEPASFARAAGTLALAFLATWVAGSNSPALLGVLFVESLRAVRSTKRAGAIGAVRALGWKRAIPVGAVFTGVVLESGVRLGYYLYCRAFYGNSFRTPLRLDIGHLQANAASVLLRLGGSQVRPILLLAVLLGCAGLGALLFAAVGKRPPGSVHAGTVARLNTLAFPAACATIAATQAILLVVIQHFRENLFDPRYFTLIEFMLCVAGLHGILAGLAWAGARAWSAVAQLRRKRPGGGATPGGPAFAYRSVLYLALAAAAWTAGATASGFAVDTRVNGLRARARVLAERSPGTLFMGSYWDTYVLAGLLPAADLRPLALEGQYLRMPWIRGELRQGTEVVVVTLAEGELPRAELVQYGAHLSRTQATWRSVDGARFSLYRVTKPAPERAARSESR